MNQKIWLAVISDRELFLSHLLNSVCEYDQSL